ncbi:hypothetical protein G6F62_014391 [Rhizopus arrhizus]|nr:hypothetical protein G6F62_014391 [Rhizopus arrhizus]
MPQTPCAPCAPPRWPTRSAAPWNASWPTSWPPDKNTERDNRRADTQTDRPGSPARVAADPILPPGARGRRPAARLRAGRAPEGDGAGPARPALLFAGATGPPGRAIRPARGIPAGCAAGRIQPGRIPPHAWAC